MIESMSFRPRRTIAALIAIVFGVVTIVAGGKTLFASVEQREAAPIWFSRATAIQFFGPSHHDVSRKLAAW